MAERFSDARDVDTDEIAALLRNIAHGLEEDDIPLVGIETETKVEADDTFRCQLKLDYIPNEKFLIPANRIMEDD